MRLAPISLATLPLLLMTTLSRAQLASPQQTAGKLADAQIVADQLPGRPTRAQALSCPVNLDVRHGAGFGQMVATDRFTRKPIAQTLDVTITNYGSDEIASLDVIVQVRRGKSRVMPLVREEDDLGERLPLHLGMSVKADKHAAASWNVASSNAVAYVELMKVTYRDGSSWSAARGETCQFTPDPMMLISSR